METRESGTKHGEDGSGLKFPRLNKEYHILYNL